MILIATTILITVKLAHMLININTNQHIYLHKENINCSVKIDIKKQ